MNLVTLERQPVRPLRQEGPSLCDLRGHCGPFVNEGYYNAFPEPFWHGMGDCLHCGTTRMVESEPHLPLEVRQAA